MANVRPFVHFLADLGAPVEHGFRQAGLPFSALENINNYVPSQRFWAFVGNMAQRQGIEDLGFRVGQRHGADSADPHLSRLLRQSPTLHHALTKASELVNTTISGSYIGLLRQPGSGQSYLFSRSDVSAQTPFIEQADWVGMTALIEMVRLFAGPQWQPEKICLTTHQTPCHYIREQFPDTCIQVSQPNAYITLDNSLLDLPPLSYEAADSAFSLINYEPVALDFVGALKQALQAYLQESDLNIEFAAGLCNGSKRSLQRKLAKAGTRYSDILDDVRFNQARDMLQDPEHKVTDVAHRLGYSDSAHFSRAFRRVVGTTPREYREG